MPWQHRGYEVILRVNYLKAYLANISLLGLVMAILGAAFVAFVGYAVVADVQAEKSNLIAASAREGLHNPPHGAS